MPSERFAIGLTPLPTAARVSRQRGALKWRIISSIVSLGILIAVLYFFGRDWSRGWVIFFIVMWVVSTVFWFAVNIVGLQRAKRDLGRIQEGVALYLDGHGIEFVQPTAARVPWGDVTALKLAGRNAGAGPSIVVEAYGKELASVPISFLDATPAVIDSAARACSLGRIHLETKALDRLI